MSRFRVVGRFILGSFIFLILAGLSGWLTLVAITRTGDVLVPEVVGHNLSTAVKILQEQRLYCTIEDEINHAEIPKGFVIEQKPAPGELRKRYASIKLIISKGPERFSMPNLCGIGVRQARIEIERLSLGEVTEIKLKHPTAGLGDIISHIPGPGEVIFPDSPVKLLISLGTYDSILKMPDLLGENIGNARRIIESHYNPKIEFISSQTYESGIVISQIPLPGEPLYNDTNIILTVTSSIREDHKEYSTFTYNVPPGILEKEMKVILENNLEKNVVWTGSVKPSEQVQLFIPRSEGLSTLKVFLDNSEVHSEPW
ncbi:PASTA domain-containing protein [bacterium]|nr:PASTA domain-containing protein [candidate division CSSED10-310 bacterium]